MTDMDLFTYQENGRRARLLADRMRPETLDEYIGQEHIRRSGQAAAPGDRGRPGDSILLYGPPGCGKTTLAHIISKRTQGRNSSASTPWTRPSRTCARSSSGRERTEALYGRKTICSSTRCTGSTGPAGRAAAGGGDRDIVFIGATTENPYHTSTARCCRARRCSGWSRSRRSSRDRDAPGACRPASAGSASCSCRWTKRRCSISPRWPDGDIRRALNALELAAVTTPSRPDGTVHITLEVAEESIRQPTVQADESTQYDVLSAFHKSMRGSSDAALFWFLYAVEKLGMDPMMFLRRLTVACSEDIGLANPQAMVQAVTAMDAYHRIGWPEAKYNVAQAILFAVESPKSNAVRCGHRPRHEGDRDRRHDRGAAASARRPLQGSGETRARRLQISARLSRPLCGAAIFARSARGKDVLQGDEQGWRKKFASTRRAGKRRKSPG